MNRGLLLAISDEPEGNETEFNKWYDKHASARLTVPGITAARRYVAVAGRPRYLADYELESVGVMTSDAYRALRSNRPPGEQEMLDLLPAPIDRRIYEQLGDSPAMSATDRTATHTIAVWSKFEQSPVPPGTDGWLHCRQFRLVDGAGPEFLALHDVASLAAAESLAAVVARDSTEHRTFTITHRYR